MKYYHEVCKKCILKYQCLLKANGYDVKNCPDFHEKELINEK